MPAGAAPEAKQVGVELVQPDAPRSRAAQRGQVLGSQLTHEVVDAELARSLCQPCDLDVGLDRDAFEQPVGRQVVRVAAKRRMGLAGDLRRDLGRDHDEEVERPLLANELAQAVEQGDGLGRRRLLAAACARAPR